MLIIAALLTATLSAWGQARKVNESWTMTAHNYETNRCTFIWFAHGAATLRVTTVCAPHTTLNVGDVVEPIIGIFDHHGDGMFTRNPRMRCSSTSRPMLGRRFDS